MGAEFGLDPVAILADTVPVHWAVRAAAWRAVQTERRKAEDRAKKG